MMRLGLRISPSPTSDLLGSVIYSDRDGKVQDSQIVNSPRFGPLRVPTDRKISQKGPQIEVGYLLRGTVFNATSGISSYHIDVDDRNAFPGSLSRPRHDHRTVEQESAYFYSQILVPQRLVWTIGASYDDYNAQDSDTKTLSPKIGIEWNVAENVLLRAAAFRTVKPALLANRTIQPTEVAGFNQFYDDINGTVSWRYGVAVDARLVRSLYGGLEISWRELDQPAPSATGREFTEDRDEQSYRGYLYLALNSNWVMGTEAQLDVFEGEKGAGDLPTWVQTISVPLVTRYFDERGLFGEVGWTFVHQNVDREEGARFAKGDNNFQVVDAAVGYRFPQRRGSLSLRVRNLFDAGLKFQDDSFRTAQDQPAAISPFFPRRSILALLNLGF